MCVFFFSHSIIYIYISVSSGNYNSITIIHSYRRDSFRSVLSPTAKLASVDKIYTSSFDILPNPLHVRLINYIFIVNTFGG